MPDRISCSNPSSEPSAHYDFEAGICQQEPLAANTCSVDSRGEPVPRSEEHSASPPPEVAILVEQYTAASADSGHDCALPVARATLACVQAVKNTLESAPTLLGGLVSAIVGGASCGMALAEADQCLSRQAE